jgi:thioredoxin reductase
VARLYRRGAIHYPPYIALRRRIDWDVIIVGAGPAGLSAALILGRCRRRVLVVDSNRPRNSASRALHGFLTRDGVPPKQLRRLARLQLAPYRTVALRSGEATRARRRVGGFEITLSDGSRHHCRKLLLATGVVDDVPNLEGLAALYGRSVFHCPYCDGWECRDKAIAVYGRSRNAVELAIKMKVWSNDLVVCTDGVLLPNVERQRAAAHGIAVRREPIERLVGSGGRLRRIVFAAGDDLEREAMFFSTGQRQGSDLAASLDCAFTRKGAVRTGEYEATNIPGLFVAGDASRLVQLAIVAASEGAQAAFAINSQLIEEDSGYSVRSVTAGSTRDARRAGK